MGSLGGGAVEPQCFPSLSLFVSHLWGILENPAVLAFTYSTSTTNDYCTLIFFSGANAFESGDNTGILQQQRWMHAFVGRDCG